MKEDAPAATDYPADTPFIKWRLSHGHVVLAGGGAVVLDNLEATPPMPPALLYAPSDESTAADWHDFDGDDGPYTLVGWAFLAPMEGAAAPHSIACLSAEDWFIHEAGWHLLDGGHSPDTRFALRAAGPTRGRPGRGLLAPANVGRSFMNR